MTEFMYVLLNLQEYVTNYTENDSGDADKPQIDFGGGLC